MRRVLLIMALIGTLGLVSVPAMAQDDEPAEPAQAPTLVRSVDARDPEAARLEFMYGGDDVDSVVISEGGQPVQSEAPVLTVETDREIGTVFVVDTGTTMADSGALERVKAALLETVASMGANQRIGIITAGDNAQLLTDLTTSVSRLEQAVNDLDSAPEGKSETWSGLLVASELLIDDRDAQPNVVVFTSGADTVDGSLRERAEGEAIQSGQTTFITTVASGETDLGAFESLVETTGGSLTNSTPDFVGDEVLAVQSWLLADQYTVVFDSSQPPTTEARDDGAEAVVRPSIDAELIVGEVAVEYSYVAGRFEQGATKLATTEMRDSGFLEVDALRGDTGRLIGLVLVVVAVALATYAIARLFVRDDSALSNLLEPYAEEATEPELEADGETPALAQTAVMQRAVSLTEQVAEQRGYLSRTESALERADLPLRAGESLFFYLVGVVLVVVVGLIFFPPTGALILGFTTVALPLAIVSFLGSRRQRKFNEVLPDMLQLLSGTLRAGYSLMQGVEAVSQEVAEPMGKEMRRVVTEARLGRPLEDSLEGVAERMASPDFAWAVMAIRIQREVGGNLSELLMTVAETMIQRERLRRDIQALTAEGRISAVILGLLPVGLGLIIWTISPDYLSSLFDTTLGNILLALSIVAMGIGFAWMRQIIDIDI